MSVFKILKKDEKEALALLQIGTFLEYFDLMLYVHMAVVLNDLFFPKVDPHTAALLSALAFCSTFILRPFGAILFGYIGDQIGRKTTVIITTTMMSTSCVIMANLPTYEQIGITAAWVVTLCRFIQGLSSMGEIMGAQIYIAEITKAPIQYVAVSFVGLASAVGSAFALGVSFLVTSTQMSWRTAFWLGAGIAVVGSVARTRLRETPEFLEMKEKETSNGHEKKSVDWKVIRAYFAVYCGWPLTFYLVYMYFNPILKNVYGYTAENIISHNFLLSILLIVSAFIWTIMAYRIHPLILLRIRYCLFTVAMASLPFLVSNATSHIHIFFIQAFFIVFNLGDNPGAAIFIRAFPTLRRFTFSSLLYAISRALMYIITSFGLVYLTRSFDIFGIWIVAGPVVVIYAWGIEYFKKNHKVDES
ncbi:MAG: Proline/betaine transporter [Holosporales bacterium]